MKYLFYLLVALFFFNCENSKENDGFLNTISSDNIKTTEVDSFILKQMDSLKIPAISIAIINNSEIVYHRTFGVRSIETSIPIDSENIFDAGSLTKTPFAYLVMKMVDKNQLDLDKPLYQYLPYPDIEYDKRYKLITARMVLCHSTGFPNWRFLNDNKKLDIKFTPGSDFGYSGEGYKYLSKVLAHLNNLEQDSLEIMMRNNVYNPLKMYKSSTIWNDKVASRRTTGHILGEVKDGWGINSDDPGFHAAYSLQTEAYDYANFIIGLMKGQGLSQESINEMLKTQIISKDKTTTWGLGIEIEKFNNGKILYKHRGFNKNFSAGYLFSKESNNGFVFFTNNDTGYVLNDILKDYFIK